jgi:hypothetical protein
VGFSGMYLEPVHSGGFNKNATTSTKSVVFNDLIAASASAREQSAIEHAFFYSHHLFTESQNNIVKDSLRNFGNRGFSWVLD